MRARIRFSPGAILTTLLLFAPCPLSAFYLPGVAPTSYKIGDKVPLNVNRLTPRPTTAESSRDTRVRSVFSYDYYHKEFHFCRPEDGPKNIPESLGSILFGDRIQTSPFDLRMGMNESCKALCKSEPYEPDDAKFVNRRIFQNYDINWLIDGLPAGELGYYTNPDTQIYSPGFPLGWVQDHGPALNNHYKIFVDYHQVGKDQYRVVGVFVNPYSIKDSKIMENGKADCPGDSGPAQLSEKEPTEIAFTYSVYWIPSATPFATRWDKYLRVYDANIHWLSLVLSAILVVLLVSMVSSILLRTLRKDIARYNRLDQVALDDLTGNGDMEDGVQEDSGWKLVHGDVFRPPKHPMLLSILLGNGAQLFMMAGFTIVFALFGFLSPSSRGSLGTAVVLLYTVFGFISGYVSARAYKFFHGEAWKQNFIYTPIAIPSVVFSTFFLLNLLLWARQASGAVPLTTMIVIVCIWFIISLPLSLIGSWIGFRTPNVQPPVRTNQIPRQIPPAPTFLQLVPSTLLAGVLPFIAVFVELYFIVNSIWFSMFYYMFGFLFLCYGLVIMTCAAVTVHMIYFLLCAENYHWQWRAFFNAGASAIYVFAYLMIFWARTLSFSSWLGGILYLGYSALFSMLFFVLTGTIGFFASWIFVMKIYGSIKVD